MSNFKPSGAVSSNKLRNSRYSNLKFVNVLEQRRMGYNQYKLGYDDKLALKLYSNFFEKTGKMNTDKERRQSIRGIFNLEYSLDGKLVVAACEGKQILIYDASNHRHINTVENAHLNCVNCVRYLNDKQFATCSDDTSIKLWDMRNVKSCLKTLYGHSNWVKNIEWSESEKVMVTSAFDGSIYAWNLQESTENNVQYNKLFSMNGLMRMKITNDSTKMVISTTSGYIMIIHDLNLSTLTADLRMFRPNLYRLMQISEQCFPVSSLYNTLFSPTRSRNRIEFIDDFPNEAEVISSLQIHPHGWCCLSRNMNSEENEEWTTVHDIQTRDPSDYENAFMIIEEPTSMDDLPEDWGNHRPTDLWMGYMSLEEHIQNQVRFIRENAWENLQLPSMGILNSGLIGSNTAYRNYFRDNPEDRNKVIKNLSRMTHYIKEDNISKGNIKEQSFSRDGRIMCSPHDSGIRLLAFSDKCQELSMCVPDKPQQLKCILAFHNFHLDPVVSCKFSPTNYQLVSGCLGSQINWYQPVIT